MKVTGKNNYSIFLPVTGLQLTGNGPPADYVYTYNAAMSKLAIKPVFGN